MSATPEIFGLVLAGGRSTRMGRDKAGIRYDGRTQLERAMALLGTRVPRSFVSVREDQGADPLRAGFPRIVDRAGTEGPIAGILAAQASHPGAAWLVLACDLPFLDGRTLDHLIGRRERGSLATAYRSSHDGLPEPLCAIWEPESRAPLERYVEGGGRCPRKFLIRSQASLLEQPDPRALDNVNTPEEYGSAMSMLSGESASAEPRTLRVQYYALLREQAGRSEESLATPAASPAELYAQLRTRHGFTLEPDQLRVAVNGEFGEWNQRLSEGDVVVFIPPVAGG